MKTASIYQRKLGKTFQQLHPQIQKRFGFSSHDRMMAIGKGVMDKVWRGKFYTLPFLQVGTWRHIMFPTIGERIPFTIENYAYLDSFGRETVTWVRRFHFPDRVRCFDATMIYSEQRDQVIDYLGTHQHLAVDIDLSVADNGGLQIRSGEQRFYEGPIAFQFPMLFSGVANVCEWFDDGCQQFRIKVVVRNPVWGDLFGYEGAFEVTYEPVPASGIPAHVKPRREEVRE